MKTTTQTPAVIAAMIDTTRAPEVLDTGAALDSLTEWPGNGPTFAGEGFEAPAAGADTPRPAFVPDTREKADWVLKQIAARRDAAARIRENGEAMARQEEAEAERLEWQFRPALHDLARRELGEGGRKKSLRLFHGVIGFKTRPAALTVTDQGAALAWARENLPEAVTEHVDRKALADALLSTGEVFAGVSIAPAEETFYIR